MAANTNLPQDKLDYEIARILAKRKKRLGSMFLIIKFINYINYCVLFYCYFIYYLFYYLLFVFIEVYLHSLIYLLISNNLNIDN